VTLLVVGESVGGFGWLEEALVGRPDPILDLNRAGGLSRNVAVPVGVRSCARAHEVLGSVGVVDHDFERCVEDRAAAPAHVRDHEESFAEQKSQFGSEEQGGSLEEPLEDTGRFLPEVETTRHRSEGSVSLPGGVEMRALASRYW